MERGEGLRNPRDSWTLRHSSSSAGGEAKRYITSSIDELFNSFFLAVAAERFFTGFFWRVLT